MKQYKKIISNGDIIGYNINHYKRFYRIKDDTIHGLYIFKENYYNRYGKYIGKYNMGIEIGHFADSILTIDGTTIFEYYL